MESFWTNTLIFRKVLKYDRRIFPWHISLLPIGETIVDNLSFPRIQMNGINMS